MILSEVGASDDESLTILEYLFNLYIKGVNRGMEEVISVWVFLLLLQFTHAHIQKKKKTLRCFG